MPGLTKFLEETIGSIFSFCLVIVSEKRATFDYMIKNERGHFWSYIHLVILLLKLNEWGFSQFAMAN